MPAKGTLLAFLVLAACTPPALAQRDPWTWIHRYHFDIDAKTPLKDLLPTPPKDIAIGKLLVADLAQVPEVQLAEPYIFKADFKKTKELNEAQQRALIHIAHQVAKVNFANKNKTDRFMEEIVAHRPDLRGLPFTLGETCRLKKDARSLFRREVNLVRLQLAVFDELDAEAAPNFWIGYDRDRQGTIAANALTGNVHEKVHPIGEQAAVAALMQMLGPQSAKLHPGLIEQMARFQSSSESREQSSQALARLAVFSIEDSTRKAAVNVLKKRDAGPTTPILLQGLRYPWPSVAKNAADVIVQLKRSDLMAELIKMLDEPDPRAPTLQPIGDKKVPAVREVVRINHHRNCLLCHPSGNSPEIFGPVAGREEPPSVAGIKRVRAEHVGLHFLRVGADLAPIPHPGKPFPTPSEGYGRFSNPDILIRADATYLRQDFSMMQKVANAHPWPEMQRFDFLVRTRIVTDQEAKAYQAEFSGKESPYRQTALDALRRLTGRDAGTTAKQWRDALKLP